MALESQPRSRVFPISKVSRTSNANLDALRIYTGSHEIGEMQEHIRPSSIGENESKAPVGTPPFQLSGRHPMDGLGAAASKIEGNRLPINAGVDLPGSIVADVHIERGRRLIRSSQVIRRYSGLLLPFLGVQRGSRGSVPELTPSAGIQLNERGSLPRDAKTIA